jgi:hypothetical protein
VTPNLEDARPIPILDHPMAEGDLLEQLPSQEERSLLIAAARRRKPILRRVEFIATIMLELNSAIER